MKKMTEKALQEAFAGESMAHMKYLAFSEIAEEEVYLNLARLFRAIAFAEQVHATNYVRALGMIKETEENLKTGIQVETFEIEEMYPAYDAIAKLQGEKGAERSIQYAIEAEKIYHGLYKETKVEVEKGRDVEIQEVYIRPVCGYTHTGEPLEKCPVCNLPREKFKKF